MNAAVHERMVKVEALTRSPVAGEAAAARAMLAKLEAKHGALPRSRPAEKSTIADIVAQHEWAMAAYARAASRRTELRDWDDYCRIYVDRLMRGIAVERAAEWLIDHGEACVQVSEAWFMASTGTRVCMPHEVVTRAMSKGMRP